MPPGCPLTQSVSPKPQIQSLASQFCGPDPIPQRTESFCGIPANVVPARLDRLCKAGIRWPRAGCSLSRELHAPHCDLQSPADCIRWRELTFRWRDYARGNKQPLMTVSAEEFIRRFLVHVLPKGFVRIRHLGFMANGPSVCIIGTVS